VLFIILQKQVCLQVLPGDSLLFLAGIYNREIENVLL
jgi:hypothetical protein